ncbi:YggS family pyridoxal phosphate-dependent enzyme [Shimia ponticola]|uniref:YggS family pyridoxal phosphate-dependent enzyme n=1 Tax=Shimia ponticola TaxID=2582893 RepID=UPI0011BE6D73|nr:YggS family pyridoxal phosphate-dependent enzyme [Shimia ponticola]
MSYADITERVAEAERAAGRPEGSVHLIAVSKVQPEPRVRAVLEQGHRLYGENRVQEAEERWSALKPDFPDTDLHLVGPLQSNKVRPALELFSTIHSLDRPKLAKAIARIAQEVGHSPNLFIQVNTGEEPQKAGITPDDLDAFVAECRSMDLNIQGLMCLPPVDEEAALHFALLAKLAERNGLKGLSMGMSADFDKAIKFGATHIRVGSAIFGERVKPA